MNDSTSPAPNSEVPRIPTEPAPAADLQSVPRRRRGVKLFLAGLASLMLLLAAAPSIVSHTSLRHWVTGKVMGNRQGQVTVAGTSLGWLSAVELQGIELHDQAGGLVLEADAISLDRSLLQLIWQPSQLGKLRLERPRLNIEIKDREVNMTQVFGPPPAAAAGKKRTELTEIEIIDGSITLADRSKDLALTVTGLAITVDPAASGTTTAIQISGDVTIERPPHATLYEPPLKVALQGSFDRASHVLTVTRFDFRPLSGPLACSAQGQVSRLDGVPLLDLKGELSYDLPQLAARLRPWVGGELELAGEGRRAFEISGPLGDSAEGNAAEGKTAKQGSWLTSLKAEAQLGWTSASCFGVNLGPADVKAELIEGRLRLSTHNATISEGRIDLRTHLDLAASNPVLVVESGRLVEGIRLTPETAASGLMYIAPALAGATSVEGRFSLDLDECRVPLSHAGGEALAGKLQIHNVDIGPGPFVQAFANLLNVTPRARLINDSIVTFELQDNRVHHQGFEFQVATVKIRTSGSVGLDQTLDLVAEMPVPDTWLKDGVLSNILRGQGLRLPVRGTLSKPEIDVKSLGAVNSGLLGGAVGELLRGALGDNTDAQAVGSVIQELLERRSERPGSGTPWLNRLRDRLRRGDRKE